MIRHKEKVTLGKEGRQHDLFFLLLKELLAKVEEKEIVSYEIERFMEKIEPKEKWETYKPTGREEIRVAFEPREEKDGG